MENQQRTALFVILLLALGGVVSYLAFNPGLVSGALTGATNTAEDSNPFGESLSVDLNSGASTSGTASFMQEMIASYQDSDSQNVYEVNSTYKSQEQVTMDYDADVTYANVGSITITAKIKAIDKADQSEYEYTLANAKSISGASPISDSGSTVPSISTHLASIVASTTDATISYEIYVQVTATGSVSGDTLTATIPYTTFGCLRYEQTGESSQADVTPTVSVASYTADMMDDAVGMPQGTFVTFVAIIAVFAAVIVYRRN